ncbi:helix-turn-helix domain-containing protein [Salinicola avicenniae]|uniref:helix-turn-helix domain-containing protein n=1 Tax=Salinicola avicenniae TaxID=2916836 RepID=UPI002073DEAA|nr:MULTISPECIES: XRE family transcriptional regulator [unclassified Salinicola]
MEIAARLSLGQHLQGLRQERGLSLSQLAGRAGIAKSNLSRLEQGQGNPTLDTLWRLARELDTSFGSLVAPIATPVEEPGVSVTLIERSDAIPAVDAYLMHLAPNTLRRAEAHPTGTRETLQVIAGELEAGTSDTARILGAGDLHRFAADRPHHYRTRDNAASVLVTVLYATPGEHHEGADTHE